MHRLSAVALGTLLALPLACAESFRLVDGRGDGDPDILQAVAEADTTLELTVDLAQPPPTNVAVRIFWGRGTAGEAEPKEWYVAFVHQGDVSAMAGHGGQSRQATANATWTDSTLTVALQRVDPVDETAGPCTVLALEVGASATGFEASDQAPDGRAALQDAWPTQGTCPEAAPADAPGNGKAKGSPGPGLIAFAGLAFVAAALRRRR